MEPHTRLRGACRQQLLLGGDGGGWKGDTDRGEGRGEGTGVGRRGAELKWSGAELELFFALLD